MLIKGVYCLTSPSGKRYVGVGCGAGGIQSRWSDYKALRCEEQVKIYNALKKYGAENFKYEVVLETDDADNAKRSEMYLIDVWNLQDDKYGYNITGGGEGMINITDEIREKMSVSAKNRVAKNGAPFAGKKHSLKTKEFMSNSKKGSISNNKGKKSPLTTGILNHKVKKIKIQNIITNEIFEDYLINLIKEHNFSRSSLLKYNKSKNYRRVYE